MYPGQLGRCGAVGSRLFALAFQVNAPACWTALTYFDRFKILAWFPSRRYRRKPGLNDLLVSIALIVMTIKL